MTVPLEAHLREQRGKGRKLLVPYVTGGLGREWCDVVRAVIDAGADAVEIGIPFSDPIMDGRTIQEASQTRPRSRRNPDRSDRRARRGRRAGPADRHDVLQPRRAPRARAHRGSAAQLGRVGRDPSRPAARRAQRLGRRRRRGRRCHRAPRRADHARRPPQGHLRAVARVRLRRVAPRRHRRTRARSPCMRSRWASAARP